MKPSTVGASHASDHPVETLTIRMAVSADAGALRRLAELDSAPRPAPVAMLVAEVGDELRAALPLDGGPAIANPFQPTAELVVMLVERARQLELSAPRRAARRWLPLWSARGAVAPRVGVGTGLGPGRARLGGG